MDNSHETPKKAGATTRGRPRRITQSDTVSEMDLMLALVASDKIEVETPPDVTRMASAEAAQAMANYYGRVAEKLATGDAARRERTRGLIIIGALAAQLPSAARALFADMFVALKPADMACVRSIAWARAVLDRPANTAGKSSPESIGEG